MINTIGLPKNRIVWCDYKNRLGETICIISSNANREWYYLHDFVNGEFVERGKAKEPTELVDKFNVYERMRA